MAATDPARIRNVAVVGHRGTGKTSLVEALLYQTGEVNRLGAIDAGTTVSDWDEDEQGRAMSISLSLAHTTWQERKVNLLDVPGDPGFQGESRCALHVVEGALVVVSGVMGLEVGTARVKRVADELGLARVLFVNMLDRERADFFRTLEQIQEQFSSTVRRRAPADRGRARAARHRRRAAHVRLPEPRRRQGRRTGRDPGRHDRPRAGVPREAARRGRADRRGADGALPRGRRARRARRGGRAQGRGHARRGVPRRVRRRDEEPRHARAARPDRRGRAVARQEGPAASRSRARPTAAVVFKTIADPFAGKINLFRVLTGHGDGRLDARRRARALEGAHGHAAAAAGQGAHRGQGVRRRRPRRRRQAQGRPDRRPARRPGRRRPSRSTSASPSR